MKNYLKIIIWIFLLALLMLVVFFITKKANNPSKEIIEVNGVVVDNTPIINDENLKTFEDFSDEEKAKIIEMKQKEHEEISATIIKDFKNKQEMQLKK